MELLSVDERTAPREWRLIEHTYIPSALYVLFRRDSRAEGPIGDSQLQTLQACPLLTVAHGITTQFLLGVSVSAVFDRRFDQDCKGR